MNRIKRISAELLQKYPDKFGLDFNTNKNVLGKVATIRSKVLRNELAGYITAHLRKQAAQQKASMVSSSEVGEVEEEAEE
ncbi:MAG: 30S ribosomal protein S17e [Thermoproteota archaeon]|nr:30S ribosomal protein S17e [Thermoproteota archaeon]